MSDKITWENFLAIHGQENARNKFEDLCRQLFEYELLIDKHEPLHSNPNNPGIEVEPVFNPKTKEMISFQAKFFDKAVNYTLFKNSAIITVKHYAGILTHVYLFSNIAISTERHEYDEILSIFEAANIKVSLFSDKKILDAVRKYDFLANYYFENHNLSFEWFSNRTNIALTQLGERYNKNFNIPTKTSLNLSIFLHDQTAIKAINNRKHEATDFFSPHQYTELIELKPIMKEVYDVLVSIPDITEHNITDCLTWYPELNIKLSKSLATLDIKQNELIEQIHDLYKDNRPDINNKIHACREKINEIDDIKEHIKLIMFSNDEENLLKNNILVIESEAGYGKSHILANEAVQFLEDKRWALLLLGQEYLYDQPIQKQTMDILELSFGFKELLQILNNYGRLNDCIVPILFDAVNEIFDSLAFQNCLASLATDLQKFENLRLVISIREDYKEEIIPDNFLNKFKVVSLEHMGLDADNNLESVKNFLNANNIQFIPADLLNEEITNPLFLTLYCKTSRQGNISIPTLYNSLLSNIERNLFSSKEIFYIFKNVGVTKDTHIVDKIIGEICTLMIRKEQRFIAVDDILDLPIWKPYQTYLNANRMISELVRENILSYSNGKTNVRFSFDQMTDYYCAKSFVSTHKNKEEIRLYVLQKILQNSHIRFFTYQMFEFFCYLYAEEFGEELVAVIDEKNDIIHQRVFFTYYSKSLLGRTYHETAFTFISHCKKYLCPKDIKWDTFITHSTTVNSPLNAESLHNILNTQKMNERDADWTITINKLNEMARIIQIIELYTSGSKLNLNPEQIKLLLTLFSWLLSSSTRYIRDTTSKAMVEILKDNINLCEVLLQKFENVDDPYIIERLYGIVFGAVTKRNQNTEKEVLISLANYVYNNIFNQKYVYPDILLRDYARLIIEYICLSFPEDIYIEQYTKRLPPYNSKPIPRVKDYNFNKMQNQYHYGFRRIIESMKMDGIDTFGGDFGRYVYQRAFRMYSSDNYKIFNYSLYYIEKKLGYDDSFDQYDKYVPYDSQSNPKRYERIGKKYQWITLHNVIARLSDSYLKKSPKDSITDEDLFNQSLRDFDPTLNWNSTHYSEVPVFSTIIEDIKKVKLETFENVSSPEEWIKQDPVLLKNAKSHLLLESENGVQWVSLSLYIKATDKMRDTNFFSQWTDFFGYFVTDDQVGKLQDYILNRKYLDNGLNSDIPESYMSYNREYPWYVSCDDIKKQVDKDIILYDSKYTSHIMIGKAISTTVDWYWNSSYDVSSNGLQAHFAVPCPELIESLKLSQMENDGYFFDQNGTLAAFDTSLSEQDAGLVIRKDLLDDFLSSRNLKLVWAARAEKYVKYSDYRNAKSKRWSGIFEYKRIEIEGNYLTIETN